MSGLDVVISRSRAGDGTRRKVEDGLASLLAERGVSVLIIPHIYDLSATEGAGAKLASLPGPVVVASWLHPRAAEWTLRCLGFRGQARCISLAACETPDSCVSATMHFVSTGNARGVIEEIFEETRDRWYPVIDFSRCNSCGQCAEFCLFGVFDLCGDGKPVVKNPANCKPGCPACARVCPAGAIIFPLYEGDEAIAGAVVTEAATATQHAATHGHNPSQAARKAIARGVVFRCPVCGCACDCQRSVDGTAPAGTPVCPECGCICDHKAVCACHGAVGREGSTRSGFDDVDDLIDALDKLDV